MVILKSVSEFILEHSGDKWMDKLQFYIRKYKNADEKQREVIHRLFKEECIRQFKEEHKFDDLKNTLRITSTYGL